MGTVTCGKCGAAFDLTPELPEVFTCGACGAEVSVPKAAPRPVPARAPAPRPAGRPPSRPMAAPPAGRPAARPARPGAAQRHREAAPAPEKKSKTLLYAGLGGGALVVIVVAYLLINSSSTDATKDKPKPVVPPVTKPAETKPAEATPAKPSETADAAKQAPAPEPEPPPDDTGGPEMVRFKRTARLAQTAQQHYDAAKFGRGQLEAVKKANPQNPEIAEFDQRIKAELEKAVRMDDNLAAAHAELGHVRYGKAETAGWIKSDRVPGRLVTTLEEAVSSIESELKPSKDPVWLTGPLAEKYGPALAEACTLHEDRGSSKTSWFYTKADKLSKRIEGEFGVHFSESRDKDAFDPVIFRPYLLMVQKDPKQKSVDRAYEVVQLVRTLEETWRRRYAKEIDFSGSMAAPPIILLKDRAAYEKYNTRNETKFVPVLSAGHYEPPPERRIVIYKSDPEQERVVIFHEGTHMLFDHKTAVKSAEAGANQSMWFSEGIAEYFGGHGPSGERDPVTGSPIWEPGRINDTRIDSMDVARKTRNLIKFQDLVQTSRSEWARRNEKERFWSQMIYAQGWALVYFLNHGESGKYQKDFVEYMKLELAGKSGMEAFKEVFGKYGMDQIEKGYDDFLAYIIKKHKEKKIVGGKILD